MPDLTIGPPDATPLTADERRGLRLPVLTRDELNLAEAQNIGRAAAWLFLTDRRLRPEAVIEEAWLKRMYGQIWNWAGQYRTSDRNLVSRERSSVTGPAAREQRVGCLGPGKQPAALVLPAG